MSNSFFHKLKIGTKIENGFTYDRDYDVGEVIELFKNFTHIKWEGRDGNSMTDSYPDDYFCYGHSDFRIMEDNKLQTIAPVMVSEPAIKRSDDYRFSPPFRAGIVLVALSSQTADIIPEKRLAP